MNEDIPGRAHTEDEALATARRIEQHLRSIRNIRRHAQMSSVQADMQQMALTPVQIQAMEMLVEGEDPSGGMSLKELSSRMGLAHSTTSGIVDRLERHGLVHRAINPQDRRQIRIQVDEEVMDFMRNTWPLINLAPFMRALERASESERAKVLEGLAILDRLLATTSAADAQEAGS